MARCSKQVIDKDTMRRFGMITNEHYLAYTIGRESAAHIFVVVTSREKISKLASLLELMMNNRGDSLQMQLVTSKN